METQLQAGEALLKQGRANLQRGLETVGGRLYLTTVRLIFEPHRFNVQTGVTSVLLQEIAGVRKCWTRFLGLLPLFRNSVTVATADGKTLRLVVAGRAAWIGAIGARAHHASAALFVAAKSSSRRIGQRTQCRLTKPFATIHVCQR